MGSTTGVGDPGPGVGIAGAGVTESGPGVGIPGSSSSSSNFVKLSTVFIQE